MKDWRGLKRQARRLCVPGKRAKAGRNVQIKTSGAFHKRIQYSYRTCNREKVSKLLV